MNSTNMLSANKVKLHGMTSTKWTTKDKITQYKGLINLYTRDKKIIEMDNVIAKKKQIKELKALQKDIENNRRDLDNAIRGDKQKLRNTLAEHREMQLAFQNAQPQKVIDMVHQVNFTKRKTRDRLKYRMKLKSDKLIEFKLKYALYEDRLKYDGLTWQTMLPSERQAHLITGKVQDAILKKEAAIYIRNSYKEMIAIMKRDALYFDAILVSIRNDGLSQGKCMIKATRMGQLGTEYLDDRRQEYQFLETIVKKDMVRRKKDLTVVSENVKSFSQNLKNLLRRDSDINLGIVELEESPSFNLLQGEIEAIENTLIMLKDAIFTPSIDSIYPCIKEQLRQKNRLTEFVEKCEKNREDLKKKTAHAAIIHSELANTMIDTTHQYIAEKQQLAMNTEEQIQKGKQIQILIDNRYNLLAKVRISLKQLQYLSRLLYTGLAVKSGITIISKKGEELVKPDEDEIDGTKIIPELITKLSKLVAYSKEIISGTTMEEGFKMFEAMMHDRSRPLHIDAVISEESLIETVFLDSHVLTHDDIKKQSAEIVAANLVTDEFNVAATAKKKKLPLKK
ncbi:uncharacterized protein [Leptinotarsa decemlineata]|uniref:uncharacterized protein n=1 Tax=Leptinotarsa decemlineata TaxID=7539 RepID=UPI000C2519A6|nr:uncharacterized protein LOC111502612 [Leptinotarsa decemlineata]